MNSADFKKLQDFQLQIMDELHRICVEQGITYYIIGGTALGAIRHNGFIPWDVDIDIAMARPDYERFAEVCKTELSDRFIYRCFKNTKNYPRPHAMVCIKNTLLYDKNEHLNKGWENYGIYIDIFPLDKAPEDPQEKEVHGAEIEKIKKIRYYKYARRFKKDFKNMVVKRLVSALMFWVNMDKLNVRFDKVSREYEDTDSAYWCSMASGYKYSKQYMPAAVYGKPQLVEFSGRKYYAPEMLEDYLTRIYGDYMKLPPEEARQQNMQLFETVVFDN